MDAEKLAAHSLKAVGVSAGIIALIATVAVAALLYRNYLEIEKLKFDLVVSQRRASVAAKETAKEAAAAAESTAKV